MGYRLVLQLPFNIVLVLRDHFSSQEDAAESAGRLPGRFQVVAEDDPSLRQAVEVPFKKDSHR